MSTSRFEIPDADRGDGAMSAKLVALALTAALGGFLFGFDSAIINGTVDAVQDKFNLGAAAIGFTVSCALLGAAIGAWCAGFTSQKYGRVWTMIIASLLLVSSAIGSGLAFGTYDLIWWRFLGGIGVGFASVIGPSYIAEISPARHRGRLATLQQMALVTGIFVALLVSAALAWGAGSAAAVLAGKEAWRWMFLSEAVPALAYGLLALRLPESPRFLVEKGRDEKASQVLTDVVGVGPREVKEQLNDMRATLKMERRQSFSDLLGRFGFKKLVWVGIILSVLQQFVGINVIFYYSTTLWKSVGFQESDSFVISVITSVTNIIATLIAIALIDFIGRKKLLLIGSVIMTASLACMAAAFSQAVFVHGEPVLGAFWGPAALVAANAFVIGFGISWGPVVWVLLGEMFPNNIRALALGVGASAQWIANFVVSTSFPVLADIGLAFTYGLYAFFALVSFVFVAWAVVETKGRRLEDMVINPS